MAVLAVDLRLRLAEVIAWCTYVLEGEASLRKPLKDWLRNPELAPEVPIGSLQNGAERLRLIAYVAEKRATLLHQFKRYPDRPASDLAKGKILLYAPDENLCDGAAEYQSKGFFDVDNVPPWDTWLAIEDSDLIAWVPPSFCTVAQAGVDVNPEQCIWWADEKFVKGLLQQISPTA